MEVLRFFRVFVPDGALSDPGDKHAVQGFVFRRCLPERLARALHEPPQERKRRLYRPLVFSDVFSAGGRSVFLLGGLVFANGFFDEACEKLDRERLPFEVVEVPLEEALNERAVFATLSPIYLKGGDGKHRYPPRFRREFEEALAEHLRRKARTVFGTETGDFRVRVLSGRTVFRRYGNVELPAALAVFRIEGDPLARFAACALGAGGRTAQGFSMVVPANSRIKEAHA